MGIIRGRSERIVRIRKGYCGFWKSKARLTNSPTPIEGIDELIYKGDCDDPSSPTSDVRSRGKSPIFSRPWDARSDGIGKSGDSMQQT